MRPIAAHHRRSEGIDAGHPKPRQAPVGRRRMTGPVTHQKGNVMASDDHLKRTALPDCHPNATPTVVRLRAIVEHVM